MPSPYRAITSSWWVRRGPLGSRSSASLGILDETFGKGGKVATDFSRDRRYTDDSARALALMPERRILLAGTSGDDFSRDAALACYRADGSLDTSFGGDGSGCVTVDFG